MSRTRKQFLLLHKCTRLRPCRPSSMPRPLTPLAQREKKLGRNLLVGFLASITLLLSRDPASILARINSDVRPTERYCSCYGNRRGCCCSSHTSPSFEFGYTGGPSETSGSVAGRCENLTSSMGAYKSVSGRRSERSFRISVSARRPKRKTNLEILWASIRRVRSVFERGDVELPDGFAHAQPAVVPYPKLSRLHRHYVPRLGGGGEKGSAAHSEGP